MTFEQYYREAMQVPVEGWEFSFLDGRYVAEDLPWSYTKTAEEYLPESRSLLDMETGGGELLSGLVPLPEKVYATENYPPNVITAGRRLGPLGVKVVECDSAGRLPFADGSFDLILNRHGSFEAGELLRVLQRGGVFVTQQVGARNNIELNHFFGDRGRDKMKWDLEEAVGGFKEYGVELLRKQEFFPRVIFKDIGAVIYYLRIIQWQIDGFDIKQNREGLKRLHKKIINENGFHAREHRFFIVVRKT